MAYGKQFITQTERKVGEIDARRNRAPHAANMKMKGKWVSSNVYIAPIPGGAIGAASINVRWPKW